MSDLTPPALTPHAHHPIAWEALFGMSAGVAYIGSYTGLDRIGAIAGDVWHIIMALLAIVTLFNFLRSCFGNALQPNILVRAGRALMHYGQAIERMRPGSVTETKDP